MDIGAKIKLLRIKNQLTLEELANRSELTKGFLSLGEFFSDDRDERVVFTANDYFINEQEAYDISYIVPNAQKNCMEPILIRLHPGCESETYGPYEAEEFGYVLQGKVELHYGKAQYMLKKGQTFYLKGDREHYLKNAGESEAKVIWVSNPPSF